ncbi:hypothetical protein FRC11_006010 [Ceratobasidium sp. 423]|nr:hypothetical protein FRC11_006010 [Ceratobasidium sp. 423]
MSYWLGSSTSSSNPSLAWSMGNRGKGRILIQFPFKLGSGWYNEQPCTTFQTFQHRKERNGFKHEFILLELLDGSVCRIERMGDPDARFDAISPRGSVAHDMAQCFRPDELDQAYLGTSDVISEVTLPCIFDIVDVLKICRAIHEGEKTRNYTLQIYNCWFFSLAIQVCLTRLVAHWEDSVLLRAWFLRVRKAVDDLAYIGPAHGPSSSTFRQQAFFRLCYILNPSDHRSENSFVDDVRLRLQSRLTVNSKAIQKTIACRVNDVLWALTIGSSLDTFIEEEVKGVMIATLQERFLTAPISGSGCNQSQLEVLRYKSLSVMVDLLASAGSDKKLKNPKAQLKPKGMKRKSVDPHLTVTGSPPETNTVELDFEGTPTQVVAGISLDWHQWIISCWFLWQCIVWWLLPAILTPWGITLLSPPPDATPCIVIDQELRNMVIDMGSLDSVTCTVLEHLIENVQMLTENQTAIWDETPWDKICRFIKQRAPDNLLEVPKTYKKPLKFCFQGTTQPMAVSVFQYHVLDRIHIHAEEVERVWLGSAARVQLELEDMLSMVSKMVREAEDVAEQPSEISSWPRLLARSLYGFDSIEQIGPSRDQAVGPVLIDEPSPINHESTGKGDVEAIHWELILDLIWGTSNPEERRRFLNARMNRHSPRDEKAQYSSIEMTHESQLIEQLKRSTKQYKKPRKGAAVFKQYSRRC